MTSRIIIICVLSLVIDFVGTLAYSVRIVGVRSGRIALSFSLFNVLMLASRAANAFQAPLIAKYVELRANGMVIESPLPLLRIVLATASIATLLGGMMIPTFQRLFTAAVLSYSRSGSLLKTARSALRPRAWTSIARDVVLPSKTTLHRLFDVRKGAVVASLMNMVVVALGSCGTMAALYAGYSSPALRATAFSLTGFVNGTATLLLYLLVDPFLANLTDATTRDKGLEGHFRHCVSQMVAARFLGTVLAQLGLVPAAALITHVSFYI